MSNPVNLDEELSPAHCKCDPNQEKATIWVESLVARVQKENEKSSTLPCFHINKNCAAV